MVVNPHRTAFSCCTLLTEALTTLTHHDKTFKSLLISPASAPCARVSLCVHVSDGQREGDALLSVGEKPETEDTEEREMEREGMQNEREI